MRVQIELSETEIRKIVRERIEQRFNGAIPGILVDFEFKSTWRSTEKWRAPAALRATIDRQVEP